MATGLHGRPDVGPQGASEKPTALIADDDPAVRRLLAEILRQGGFRNVQCSTGVDALALSCARPLALVTLDWDMPELPGPDVLARLRQSGVRVPALLVSARGEFDEELISLLAPMRFVRKPFELAEIRQSIRELLQPDSEVASDDRRRTVRVAARRLKLSVPAPWTGEWQVRDVSDSGLGLSAPCPVPLGASLSLELTHRDLQDAVRRVSRVCWLGPDPEGPPEAFRIGVYLNPNPAREMAVDSAT